MAQNPAQILRKALASFAELRRLNAQEKARKLRILRRRADTDARPWRASAGTGSECCALDSGRAASGRARQHSGRDAGQHFGRLRNRRQVNFRRIFGLVGVIAATVAFIGLLAAMDNSGPSPLRAVDSVACRNDSLLVSIGGEIRYVPQEWTLCEYGPKRVVNKRRSHPHHS